MKNSKTSQWPSTIVSVGERFGRKYKKATTSIGDVSGSQKRETG
jgi:hypothetical protein